jgi:hypothetical protein
MNDLKNGKIITGRSVVTLYRDSIIKKWNNFELVNLQ